MIKLRITPDGRIRGLWTDDVRLTELGVVHVQRASHVEFDGQRQCWTVRPAMSGGPLHRWLGRALKLPAASVAHVTASRSDALAWEHEHFQPGGQYWPCATRRFGYPRD